MIGSPAAGDRLRVSAPGSLRGELQVPGDKSISHRSALLSAISDGVARIRHYSPGGDCRSTLDCLRGLGVAVREEAEQGGGLHLEIRGRGLQGLAEPERILDAGNAGTTARLLSGLLAGQGFVSILDGDASLRSRPMLRIVAPLRFMGARILGRQGGDRLPLAISGGHLRGREHRLTVASAQVKSALLLAGLYADTPTTVIECGPTRDHTERMLRAQGVRLEQQGLAHTLWPASGGLAPLELAVPGDTSSAAYWITLACLHPEARLTVRGVGLNPNRTGLFEVLRSMGASIQTENERSDGGEPVGDLTAESSRLRGTEVGGELIPRLVDEVPLLAVAALFADGTTRIRDAGELRAKESDRLATLARELARLDACVRELPDGLEISGGRRLRPSEVASHADHRLAMSLAVAGMAASGVTIGGAGAADVSYPAFWEHARQLGALVH